MSETDGKDPTARLEIVCPSCGSEIDASGHGEETTCSVCNGRFVLAGHLCPSCNTYHADEHSVCSACGAALVRLCRHCQAINWTGDDACVRCGELIDMASQLEAKSKQGTPDRLSEQMAAARGINEAETLASERRMAELMAIEEARQAELRRELVWLQRGPKARRGAVS